MWWATDESPCSESYMGKTERSLRSKFLEHRRPSSIHSEVSSHINWDKPSNSVSLVNAKILDREDDWFARGVREAIHIRTHHASLNKDGGRYQLPHIWDSLIREHITWYVPVLIVNKAAAAAESFMQLKHSVLKLIILFMKISFLCNKLFLIKNCVVSEKNSWIKQRNQHQLIFCWPGDGDIWTQILPHGQAFDQESCPRGGEFDQQRFQKFEWPGGGGMLKFQIVWYIIDRGFRRVAAKITPRELQQMTNVWGTVHLSTHIAYLICRYM